MSNAIRSYPIRVARDDDLPAMARMDGLSFGYSYGEGELQDLAAHLDLSRFLLACDGELIVGSAGEFRFEVTVPGGQAVPVPGVTWVAVSVTHRRRGILTALMDRQLRGYLSQGLPFAVLLASESGIYGRFGYGAATVVRDVTVPRAGTTMAARVDTSAVSVGTAEQARVVLPDLYRRWCAQTPGAVSRDEAWWNHFFTDREGQRAGMSERHYLLHPDGYVGFRIRGGESAGASAPSVPSDPHVSIRDDAMVTAEARAAIWGVLLSFDLYAAIETSRLPLDDPLPLLFRDPRRVQTTSVAEGLWVRLLDVEAALSARTYGVEIDAVLEVRDPLVGDCRVRLRGGPDGATCVRTQATPELRLDVATLGSAYLGGHRLDQLARAGRVEAATPGGLARLDRAFLADRAPAHGTNF